MNEKTKEMYEVTINIFGTDERQDVLKRIESEIHRPRRGMFMNTRPVLKEEYSITITTEDRREAYNAFILFCTFKGKEVKIERRAD